MFWRGFVLPLLLALLAVLALSWILPSRPVKQPVRVEQYQDGTYVDPAERRT